MSQVSCTVCSDRFSVTASITPDLDPQARAAGLEFMLKPVNPTALRERIKAALQTR